MTEDTLIPVTVLTGFLGSGKTTILSRILRDPAFEDTAVIERPVAIHVRDAVVHLQHTRRTCCSHHPPNNRPVADALDLDPVAVGSALNLALDDLRAAAQRLGFR